jgi:hypothetical protein
MPGLMARNASNIARDMASLYAASMNSGFGLSAALRGLPDR